MRVTCVLVYCTCARACELSTCARVFEMDVHKCVYIGLLHMRVSVRSTYMCVCVYKVHVQKSVYTGLLQIRVSVHTTYM